MDRHEYTARLSQLESDVREIGRIVKLAQSGEIGLATLTAIWRFGWKG